MSELLRSPRLTMIGGPNGSGKSTLIGQLLKRNADLGTHFNADDIAKTLGAPSPDISREAQARVREGRARCLAERVDYSWETVMSHPSHIDHLIEARAAGYHISLIYVATEDPDISVGRVAERVSNGGHDVPEDRIRDRYTKSIAQLPRALRVAHDARIFDNSSKDRPFNPIARLRFDVIEAAALEELPHWFRPVVNELRRSAP